MRSLSVLLLLGALAACDAHAQSTSSSSSSSSSGGSGSSSAATTTRNGETTIVTSDGQRCRVIHRKGGGTSSEVTTHPDGSLSGSTSAGGTGVRVESGNGHAKADCFVDENGNITRRSR